MPRRNAVADRRVNLKPVGPSYTIAQKQEDERAIKMEEDSITTEEKRINRRFKNWKKLRRLALMEERKGHADRVTDLDDQITVLNTELTDKTNERDLKQGRLDAVGTTDNRAHLEARIKEEEDKLKANTEAAKEPNAKPAEAKDALAKAESALAEKIPEKEKAAGLLAEKQTALDESNAELAEKKKARRHVSSADLRAFEKTARTTVQAINKEGLHLHRHFGTSSKAHERMRVLLVRRNDIWLELAQRNPGNEMAIRHLIVSIRRERGFFRLYPTVKEDGRVSELIDLEREWLTKLHIAKRKSTIEAFKARKATTREKWNAVAVEINWLQQLLENTPANVKKRGALEARLRKLDNVDGDEPDKWGLYQQMLHEEHKPLYGKTETAVGKVLDNGKIKRRAAARSLQVALAAVRAEKGFLRSASNKLPQKKVNRLQALVRTEETIFNSLQAREVAKTQKKLDDYIPAERAAHVHALVKQYASLNTGGLTATEKKTQGKLATEIHKQVATMKKATEVAVDSGDVYAAMNAALEEYGVLTAYKNKEWKESYAARVKDLKERVFRGLLRLIEKKTDKFVTTAIGASYGVGNAESFVANANNAFAKMADEERMLALPGADKVSFYTRHTYRPKAVTPIYQLQRRGEAFKRYRKALTERILEAGRYAKWEKCPALDTERIQLLSFALEHTDDPAVRPDLITARDKLIEGGKLASAAPLSNADRWLRETRKNLTDIKGDEDKRKATVEILVKTLKTLRSHPAPTPKLKEVVAKYKEEASKLLEELRTPEEKIAALKQSLAELESAMRERIDSLKKALTSGVEALGDELAAVKEAAKLSSDAITATASILGSLLGKKPEDVPEVRAIRIVESQLKTEIEIADNLHNSLS